MSWSLSFMGIGSAQAVELGSACAVVEYDGKPLLMIDCGPEALTAYMDHYGEVPGAVFITHVHLDHVGGLERLFYRTYFDAQLCGQTRIYVAAPVVPFLHERVANYPSVIAEGGANFWDAFRLIVVDRGFWHRGQWFDVFPVRHHRPNSAFGLALRNSFIYSGDTRPIPELLVSYGTGEELIAHDCGLHGNPSHTGVDDIEREYSAQLRQRLLLYHVGSAADQDALRGRGYRVADARGRYPLRAPLRSADAG